MFPYQFFAPQFFPPQFFPGSLNGGGGLAIKVNPFLARVSSGPVDPFGAGIA